MKRDYDIWITNTLTNDVEIIPYFNKCVENDNYLLSPIYLYTYLKSYIVNQIPFRVEFVYKHL